MIACGCGAVVNMASFDARPEARFRTLRMPEREPLVSAGS